MTKILFNTRTLSHFFKGIVTEICFHSAWVILFILGVGVIYERSVITLDNDYQLLMKQFLYLQNEHEEAMSLKTELSAKVNSHSDPAWVELTLMRVLGVVPEGQIKVLFKNEKELD